MRAQELGPHEQATHYHPQLVAIQTSLQIQPLATSLGDVPTTHPVGQSHDLKLEARDNVTDEQCPPPWLSVFCAVPSIPIIAVASHNLSLPAHDPPLTLWHPSMSCLHSCISPPDDHSCLCGLPYPCTCQSDQVIECPDMPHMKKSGVAAKLCMWHLKPC